MSLPKPLLCLITDRQILPAKNSADRDNFAALIDLARRAAQAGVKLIQIREKDLSARQLCYLVAEILSATTGTGAAVLVNDRIDVALACGAHGAHLRGNSLPARVARKLAGDNFIIGVSVHSVSEAQAAARAGASFVLLGPIFDTPSKRAYGAPLGLDTLAQAAATTDCPVLALGGIDGNNAGQALARGAAGIAAIRLFAQSDNLPELVHAIK
jgi:thiamine-phosphate pyrophosphorylase